MPLKGREAAGTMGRIQGDIHDRQKTHARAQHPAAVWRVDSPAPAGLVLAVWEVGDDYDKVF